MKISKYEPVSLFDRADLPHTFGDMLDSLIAEKDAGTENGAYTPAVNISEDPKGFHIDVALPGLKKEDVKIVIKNRRLTVSGERKTEGPEDNRRYHRVESRFGRFIRTFSLGKDIDTNNVNASFEDGILKIDFSKKEEAADRQINIE